PCPSGYRLPTKTELDNERASWSSNNAAGAYGSPLKLPVAGYRYNSDGSLSTTGSFGNYWSSTVDGTNARYLYFYSSAADMVYCSRANGFSVRCIKD
ncbi:MAG: FISUMP domain-containing protein, partial [Bacteroidota bacterium]|nr:FISUMP domain-containing protein [Bacteroidota bacterium]